MNSVKKRDGYHHGALRPALIAAAEELIVERGVEGFSLRETARRAGVSPAAPAHHFGDMRGLLTAIATAGFEGLCAALEAADAAAGPDRTERVRAQGIAYVRYALANRARYDLMWRRALLHAEDKAYAAGTMRAFAILDRAMRGDGAPAGGPKDPDAAASIACWALVHGFARLALDGTFGIDEMAAEQTAEALLPHVLGRLRTPEV